MFNINLKRKPASPASASPAPTALSVKMQQIRQYYLELTKIQHNIMTDNLKKLKK